ncbi:MAG: recombinase family protein [Planctomycetaceae bacterium]|nr:recombinase family protein [Planctomycetaceae bacterium]
MRVTRELEDAGYESFDVVPREYVDSGQKGWVYNRESLHAMLDDVRADPAPEKCIRIYKLDRLSRLPMWDAFRLVNEMQDAGVRWFVTSRQVFPINGDIMSVMALAMEFAASHKFSVDLSERITDKRAAHAQKGIWSGGPVPLGMKVIGERLAHKLAPGDPKEVKVVRRIFKLFVHDSLSYNTIADRLNADRVPTAKGGKWRRNTVKKILTNPAYVGDSSEKDVYVRDTHEGIITRAQWNKAKKRVEQIAETTSTPHNTDNSPTHTLTGILYCDHCGGRLHKQRQQYVCCTSKDKGAGACRNYGVREDAILPAVLRALGEGIDDLSRLISFAPTDVPHCDDEQAAQLETEIKRVDAKLDRVSRKLIDAESDAEAERYEKIESDLKAERAALTADLNRVNMSVDEAEAMKLTILQLREWYDEFLKTAVHVPLPTDGNAARSMWGDYERAWQSVTASTQPFGITCDPRLVNEALRALRAEVRLTFRTETWVSKKGNTRVRYHVELARLILGKNPAKNITQDVAARVHSAPA